MANYIKPKFTWKLFNQQNRYLSNKLDAIALSNVHNTEEDRAEILDDSNNNRMRYSVCRDRAPTSQKFVFEDKNSSNNATNLQDQFESSAEQPEDELSSAHNTGSGNGYRMFAASTTYKNVILPLKSSKLANPFPEPVKVMPSHTVSDQEKAEQMQAECRIPRSITRTKRMN